LGILGDGTGFLSLAFTPPIFGLDQDFTCLALEELAFAFENLDLALRGFALESLALDGLAAALRLEIDFFGLETLRFLLLEVFFPLEGRLALAAIISLLYLR
jgi:hypothetical protein